MESELWKIESGTNKVSRDISKSKYIPYYMFGVFIIIVSCMIACPLYLFTKGREITAFTTQQVMPVAQEGMEKMAPTVKHIRNTWKRISKRYYIGYK